MRTKLEVFMTKRVWVLGFAVALAGCLAVPSLAFATVSIDDTQLDQGVNTVGGGTATWIDQVIDMVNVAAGTMTISDEDVTVNFNGGNALDGVAVEGSSTVDVNFDGENNVEHVVAIDDANVTVAVNEHNELDKIEADGKANVTVNVTGENDIEAIENYGSGDVTIRGTECQKKDILNVEDDEFRDNAIYTTDGTLTIDHVTVNMNGDDAFVGSENGDVVIDTSKIASGDDNAYMRIYAGKTLLIKESVIDIVGTVGSIDMLTINHSDVKVKKAANDTEPYRVWSYAGIELIDEENGSVKEGVRFGDKVYYLDTEDGDDVDLEADGEPAYYKCKDDDDDDTESMPKTGDGNNPLLLLSIALASASIAGIATRRRRID